MGECAFVVEDGGHEGIDAVFGGDGVGVDEESDFADFGC